MTNEEKRKILATLMASISSMAPEKQQFLFGFIAGVSASQQPDAQRAG